jgi:signal transduction histidine kinase
MRMRPRRGALGLRGRIVGAVLVTTVATLGVAALALLGPLEQKLRHAALTTLKSDLHGSAGTFRALDLTYVSDASPSDPANRSGLYADAQATLRNAQHVLAVQVGGPVILLGYPNVHGTAHPLLQGTDSESFDVDAYDDVPRAFRSNRAYYSFGTIDGKDYARAAIPVGKRYVLAVRKPIDEVPAAVAVVRKAFITAALAGLALTLILAIPLAATIVRRLRRLRQVAIKVSNEGPAVEVPDDRARDEVGDLARTFAIMQRRLQHQEEARRAFVATASHELRTPLTSLDGMLELIADDLRGGEPDLDDARSLLERARAQSRRLGRLAADLLDLSRIDAEVLLRSEPVELGELSRAVLAEFDLGTSERGILSTLDDSTGPVWALADPGSVARILRILLDNAVQVSPDRTEIRVQLRDGPHPTLTVSDHGPGVPPDERELIFERFQRGRDSSGRAGFGLGLAIGRELAERMGGALILEDTNGSGTKFTLTLQAARAPEAETVAASGSPPVF